MEDIQRALAPGPPAVVGARVYRGARVGVMAAGRAVGGSRRLSTLSTRMFTGDVALRMTGIVDGVLGNPGNTRPTEMTVRVGGRRVRLNPEAVTAAFPSANSRMVVLLHGLIETERWWFHKPARNRTGTDFGSRLGEDLPCSPVYVRYHSGRPVAVN